MDEQNTQQPQKPYLRGSEVAAVLGCTPGTVARYAQRGTLPSIRTLGGHRRYPTKFIYRVRDELSKDYAFRRTLDEALLALREEESIARVEEL
jgi:excisionase family DNA binding protein